MPMRKRHGLFFFLLALLCGVLWTRQRSAQPARRHPGRSSAAVFLSKPERQGRRLLDSARRPRPFSVGRVASWPQLYSREARPQLFSILPEVSKWTAPTLILHGARDTLIPPTQTVLLSERLRELGKSYRSVLFPHAGHRLPRHQVEEEVIAFLERHAGSACNLSGP